MRSLCAILLALAVLLPALALACATCGCGDPTLTVMGTEQPYAGRLRFSGSVQAWGTSSGVVGVNSQDLRELRFDLGVAYAPLNWLFLGATLPLQARSVADVSLSRETAFGLGDVEVTARAFVFRDRQLRPRHLLSLLAGVKTPTGPMQRDAFGNALSLDAQLGTGSWDALGGVGYSAFFAKISLYVSAVGYLPGMGYDRYRAGVQLRNTVAVQYQFNMQWALRGALDTRLEAAGNQSGAPDGFGSGLFAFASPDVLWSPASDLLVQLGVRVPFLAVTPQALRLTPIVLLSLVYDI